MVSGEPPYITNQKPSMKVLLVNPIIPARMALVIMPPLGLGYLATSIRDKHDVEILDCVHLGLDYSYFERYLSEKRPDVVGFTSYSWMFDYLKKNVAIVKNINPRAACIAGGPHPSAMPEQTLKDIPELDYAFIGEGERGLPGLLDSIQAGNISEEGLSSVPGLAWRQNGRIRFNTPVFEHALDSFGYPSWDLLKLETYKEYAPHGAFLKKYPSAPIFATRGCPFNCTYCGAHLISGKKLRTRSVSNIMDEVEMLHSRYGINEITILDDNFSLNRGFVLDFCQGVIDRKLDMAFNCPNGLHYETLDEEILRQMKRAGWYSITIAPESGSPRTLEKMGRKVKLDEVKKKVKLVKQVGLDLVGFFIIGYPNETWEDINKTINLAYECPFDFVHFSFFRPLPGTKIFYELQEEGKLKDFRWEGLNVYNTPFYAPDGFTPAELEQIVRSANRRFYLRPQTILKTASKLNFRNARYIALRAMEALFTG